MKVEIKNRFTGAVQFTAELGAEFDGESDAIKLGAAVKIAVKAGANLAGADLAGAYLAGAYLAGADLADADLADAIDVIDAGTPNGWRAVGWRRDGVLRVRVDCQDFSIAEGRAYWDAKADRREVMAALDYIEAVARLREWPEAAAAAAAA